MICSLEVLQAKYGDCLILHTGDNDSPQVMLIDGGPSGVYQSFLKPRLLEIKENLYPDDPLPIPLVMVSHLDDDHINGIIQLASEMDGDSKLQKTAKFEIGNLWFNTFDDIIGNIQIPGISSIAASASAAGLSSLPVYLGTAETHVQGFIASTGQGRVLRHYSRGLSIPVNGHFTPLKPNEPAVVNAGASDPAISWNKDLIIHIIHPNRKRLIELQKQWDKDLEKARKKGDNSIIYASVAANTDTSAFNLSSIVVLVEFKGKKILLTGDARSDDILNGLRQKNLTDPNGKIHVDILKLPHHGSQRDVDEEFFRCVSADYYVISANGKDGNPDSATLEMLAAGTKGRDDFKILLTNKEGEGGLKSRLDQFYKKQIKDGRTFKMIFRGKSNNSLLINLLDKLNY